MNNIDKFLINYKNKIENMEVKQGPTEEEVYQLLCSYNTNTFDISKEINNIVKYVDKYVKNYLNECLQNKKDINITYVNSDQGQYQKHLEIHFNKHLPGISEEIQLYFSITNVNNLGLIGQLYKFLLDNRISFHSRLSKIMRNDLFVIGVYSKDVAERIINYIKNNNLSIYLDDLNPFVYQEYKIGIVKDIQNLNYNKYVSTIIEEYIEECILGQQDNPYTTVDLQQFVAYKFKDSNNYKDKIMSYNFACELYCIIKNTSIFSKINDNYLVELSLILLNSSNQDELLFNSQKCLYYMYQEKYNSIPKNNIIINQNIVNKILKQLEYLILENKTVNIALGYKNKMVHELIPYLYGFIAKKYKYCSDDEVKKIIQLINDKMICLINSDECNVYKIGEKTFKSSIPIIENSKGFCTIEYIDRENNMANINVIINGRIYEYLNVYIDIDNNIISNNISYYGRLYRNSIANALLDIDRNNNQLEERKKDFTCFFLSDKSKEVNKFVNVEIIKKIFSKN